MEHLGKWAESSLYGISGYATSWTRRLNQTMDRYGIQPSSKDGVEIPNGHEIDLCSLEFTQPKKFKEVVKPQPIQFVLGQEVENIIYKYKGIVTSLTLCINGCWMLEVTCQKQTDSGKHLVDSGLSTVWKATKNKKIIGPPVPEKKGVSSGPVTIARRF